MRLSVFSPATTNSQLLIDLNKIYKDYFTEQQLSTQSLEKLIEHNQTQLYVTMFNERHLGAVEVEKSGAKAQLKNLTIRQLTRRKGIAKNLLREVEKHLKHENINEVAMSLENIKEEEQQGMGLFLLDYGYVQAGNEFIKQL